MKMLRMLKIYIVHNIMFFLGVIFGAVIASLVTVSIFKNSADLSNLPDFYSLQECLVDDVARNNE